MPITSQQLLDPQKRSLPGDENIEVLRLEGQQRFDTLGFPTNRDEDWKYTNLRALSNKDFSLGKREKLTTELANSEVDSYKLVFSNGQLDAAQSSLKNLPKGLVCKPMSQALNDNAATITEKLGQIQPDMPNALASLNIGLFRDGAFIELTDGLKLKKPIELIFVSSGEQTLSLPRNLIVLGKGAQAQVIERYRSDDTCTALSNSATEVSLAKAAELDYFLIQTQGQKTSHIGAVWADIAAKARFSSFAISLGGLLTRNEFKASLNGEEAHTDSFGLFVGDKRQHMDNHTTIRHAIPNCTSRQLYKGILDGHSRGVFHGRIVVERDAQLTAAEQENPNLLLSRDAEIDTKPQLEIYADDVKCAHGATVGELDNKQIFYLQSRGINKADAIQLLTYAFAAEVIEAINIEPLKAEIEQVLAKNLISVAFAEELNN